ncbi:MAG TPA: beta-ketoacyl-ACP synthase III [Planctomycetota bacterium]|nr:beta-ketoacyl-ACP synthase III [Planctomycetota bacterium]
MPPPTRRRVQITATASCVPQRILSNADLEKMVETDDDWIMQRTGIRERRIAADGEGPSDLGAGAVRTLLDRANTRPEQVQLIACATSFPDHLFPSTAALIQHKTACVNAGAFDINSACTGFVTALSVGWQFVANGVYDRVVVIGTETLSKIVNYKDRSTCIIFGDGAGAVLLEPSKGESDILHCELKADGGQGEHVILPAGGALKPGHKLNGDAEEYFIHMNGRAVYKFAVNKFVELTENAAAACGLKVEDIDLLVPHQVNLRIIESAVEKLGIPMERVVVNIHKYGNTSSASVPVALDEAHSAGRFRRGDHLVLVAFGGGLTWGSVALRF